MMNSEGVVSVLMEAEISHCWSSDVLQMFPARCTLLISSVGKQKCTRLNALIILLTNSNHLSGIVPTRTQTHALYVSGMGRIKSQKNHKSMIINQSTGFVPFFCKLGNKIWFLLVVCINGAYEAQWGHILEETSVSYRGESSSANKANMIWFENTQRIHKQYGVNRHIWTTCLSKGGWTISHTTTKL